jgi:hypothetical protein
MIFHLCLWKSGSEASSWLAGPGPHWVVAQRGEEGNTLCKTYCLTVMCKIIQWHYESHRLGSTYLKPELLCFNLVPKLFLDILASAWQPSSETWSKVQYLEKLMSSLLH